MRWACHMGIAAGLMLALAASAGTQSGASAAAGLTSTAGGSILSCVTVKTAFVTVSTMFRFLASMAAMPATVVWIRVAASALDLMAACSR